MKKTVLILITLLSIFALHAEEKDYSSIWRIKSYREKYSYLEGFFECGSTIGNNIDKRLSKKELEKAISSKTADYIEIPVIYINFAYGNIKTNGIDSMIEYLDECYKYENFKNVSVYDLIVVGSRMGLKENEKFSWIFNEEE